MYLGKKQEAQIREAIEEIQKLTTLENCGIDFGNNKDKVKLWLQWFNVYTCRITKALDKE